jgi:hypothetical protein
MVSVSIAERRAAKLGNEAALDRLEKLPFGPQSSDAGKNACV